MKPASPGAGSFRSPAPVFSCDTLVARAASGAGMVFAKNSDRPCAEAQPLEFVPSASHAAGSYVRCQYLTIPQVDRTLAVLGSRPWWLWGFEHGVNEAGVAIGNEAIFTRDGAPEAGLLGMDLVRLGLERGSSAREAVNVIVRLLEQHGQGGDAVRAAFFMSRYQNGFVVADAREAFVLETSGRHWVHRRVVGSAAIGNLVTIEDDWDEASEGIESYARERGWWWGPAGRRLSFRSAFEDPEMRAGAEDRYAASCRFLAGAAQGVTLEGTMRHLRDHFDGGTVHVADTPEVPRPLSVCCHPGRLAVATTASMVVELRADGSRPVAWCSMASPCTGVFLPVPVGVPLPVALRIGGGAEDPGSAWWAMRALAEIVERDPVSLSPPVQDLWGVWERELLATTPDAASAARDLDARVDQLLTRRSQLLERLTDADSAGAYRGR